jgi:hypothetical protein
MYISTNSSTHLLRIAGVCPLLSASIKLIAPLHQVQASRPSGMALRVDPGAHRRLHVNEPGGAVEFRNPRPILQSAP